MSDVAAYAIYIYSFLYLFHLFIQSIYPTIYPSIIDVSNYLPIYHIYIYRLHATL